MLETQTTSTDLASEIESPSEHAEVVVRTMADRAGIFLSGLCVVHCLLTPIALIAFPALEATEYHHVFHEGLLFILPLIAVAAFIPGFRRHRDKRVFWWSLPGLAMIAVGATIFHDVVAGQVAFSIAGSMLLIRSHMINRQLCACCERPQRLAR